MNVLLRRSMPSRPLAIGMTLIEVMVGLALLSMLLGGAVLHYQHQHLVWALRRVTQHLLTDLQWAQQQARLRGLPIMLVVDHQARRWQIFVSKDIAHQCNQTQINSCVLLRTRQLSPQETIQIKGNLTHIRWLPYRALTENGVIRFVIDDSRAIQVIISRSGRVRACTEGITMTTYPPCAKPIRQD